MSWLRTGESSSLGGQSCDLNGVGVAWNAMSIDPPSLRRGKVSRPFRLLPPSVSSAGHPQIKRLSDLRSLGKPVPAVVEQRRWPRGQATHGGSSTPAPGSPVSWRFEHLVQPQPCHHGRERRAEVIGVVERSAVSCHHSACSPVDLLRNL